MDLLPEELVLHIASFLVAYEVLPLNLVSKRFLSISRDNELWKTLCFEGSPVPARGLRHREGRYGGPIPIQEPRVFELQRAVSRTAGSSASTSDGEGSSTTSSPGTNTIKGSASWDPTYPGEKVDWYNEYVARHAPLSMSWLPQPTTGLPIEHPAEAEALKTDIRGIGLFKKNDSNTLVAPLEDGSVCLWGLCGDDDRPNPKEGQMIARSRPGILFATELPESQRRISPSNAVECVSIDQFSGKVYIAAHSTLTEVDLNTLRMTSRKRFVHQITALSEGGTTPNRLTVGTTKSIHLHDPRVKIPKAHSSVCTDLAESLDTIDPNQSSTFPDFQRLYSSDHPSPCSSPSFASVDPLPLSILHLGQDIHVGGRFPSILTYDRRLFPRSTSNIYSGARISALTALSPSTNITTAHTLIAAGDYKGKGSLELYPLSASPPNPPPTRNRTSASRSKLLSLTTHGTRLLFSDSDGQLKWVERDGSTLVRRWNINTWSVSRTPDASHGIFNAGADEGDVARKVLPVDGGGGEERSEVVVWTGEKVGVVGYGMTSRFGGDGGEGKEEAENEKEGEGTAKGDERRFGRMMRRALERQADEVRTLRHLGLG